MVPLALPEHPAVSIPWPPYGHIFDVKGKVVVIVTSFNLSIPTDGWISLAFSGRGSDIEIKDPEHQTSIGSKYRYATVVLPELQEGHYSIVARIHGPDGVLIPYAGAEDAVTFAVAAEAPSLTPEMRWHCERFMHPDSC